MGGKLHYIFPSNGGLNPADTVKAKALGIDAQMAADIRTLLCATTAVNACHGALAHAGLL